MDESEGLRQGKTVKAVILAGGKGKRLGALSQHRPKPMRLIKGHPFLEYLLAWLKQYGFTDIIISSGYLSEHIEEYFGTGKKFGMKINYVVEKNPLGTAGALYNARRHINGDFILLNGDSFINAGLKDMVNYHYLKKNKITMAVTRANNIKRYGRVEIDNNGRITNFSEKSGKGKFINAGVYICSRDLFKKLLRRFPSSLEKDIFPYLGKAWIRAYKVNKFFMDIGTVKDYSRLKSMSRCLPTLNPSKRAASKILQMIK